MTLPIGTIVNFAGIGAPQTEETWHVCNGQELPRNGSVLFDVIGGAFGDGSDQRSFTLPDLRGRFARAVDATSVGPAGVDPDADARTAMAPGGNVGNRVGSVQDSVTGPHVHQLENTYGIYTDNDTQLKDSSDGQPTEWLTDSAPGDETRPINAAFSFMILGGNPSQRLPVNAVVAYGGFADPPVAPDGDRWAICDGRALTQPDGTTVQLPDLRGLFLRGADSCGAAGASGRDPDVASRTGSDPGGIGSLQWDQVREHAHGLSGYQNVAHDGGGDSQAMGAPGDGDPAGPTEAHGPGLGSESRPLNAYLHFIMRVG